MSIALGFRGQKGGAVAVPLAGLELDAKSLSDQAAEALERSKTEIDARLKELGAVAERPWRKEQKLACLSAWTAAVRAG